jgi:Protein of unknown function (DUF2971)
MADKNGGVGEPSQKTYRIQSLPGFDAVPRDMQDALEKFNDEAAEIVQLFLATLELQPPPPIVYHYTNDVGLKGILETGQLWLTDIFSLNDPSELTHGFSVAINALTSKVASDSAVGQKFAKNFAAFAEQGAIPKIAHFFMCSFSSCGDDLGQWRAYADNGRGYAVGFDAKALENGYTKKDGIPIPNNSTFHITYNDAQLLGIQSQIVEKMRNLIMLPAGRGLKNTAINVYMAELEMLLTLHILQTILFFKHEAYAYEREFRFLQIHKANEPPTVKVRARRYGLVRYREFDWKSVAPDALKKIVVGPAADYGTASQFAKDTLGLFHPRNVEVTRSEIPYRA